MTREEAKALLPIIQAYAEGKTIQTKIKTDSTGRTETWIDVINPDLDGNPGCFRIKPEPKYRPFKNTEECWKEMQKHQPFGWIKDKGKKTSYEPFFITGIMESRNDLNKILFTVDGKDFAEKRMFDECVFVDGTPFGILEESV